MKKFISAFAFLLLFSSQLLFAHDVCVGTRLPHTQTYEGPTFCTDVSIHNLTVNGPLTVNGSRLYGITKVTGPITAVYTCFDHIHAENGGLQNLVSITGNSIVKGNLIFEGASGIYYLDQSSVIYGNIINGAQKKS